MLQAGERTPYRHVIVDEAQDLSPWHWRLLRAATVPGRDDLFCAGDTHQRVYDYRVSLKQLGIDITGRSTRLKISYRTMRRRSCGGAWSSCRASASTT